MPKPSLIPCSNLFNWYQSPAKKAAKHTQNSDASSALPKLRPRALTLPLPSDKAAKPRTAQKTIDQSPSPFFGKLPLEIRRLIYFEVLGGRRFHIRAHFQDRRLAHLQCIVPPTIENLETSLNCSMSFDYSTPHCLGGGFPRLGGGFPFELDDLSFLSYDLLANAVVLALPKTCRQA